jgi:enoyl-CoA hydratase/carnithine racemase
MSDDVVLTSDHGSVRVIRMHRPEARNALSVALQTQLAAAIRAAERCRRGLHDPDRQ